MKEDYLKTLVTDPKKRVDLTVTYHNYKLVQKYRDEQCTHTFYKNGKRFVYRYGLYPIPRLTRRQLTNYLKYLVDNGITAKFDKAYKTAKGTQYYPTCFFENTNKINFEHSFHNSFNPKDSYVDENDMFFDEDRYMDQLIESDNKYIGHDGWPTNGGYEFSYDNDFF